MKNKDIDKIEKISLKDNVKIIFEVCRILLPGIQTIFGFQLVAVFSPVFIDKLSLQDKYVHLVAMVLVSFAMFLILTPAVFDRFTDPRSISDRFVDISTNLIRMTVIPFIFGIILDVYLISKVITNSSAFSIALASILLIFILVMWFALPKSRRVQKVMTREII